LRDGLAVGDRAVYSRTFTESDVILFGGITGDWNPYHFDGPFAQASRFGRPIVHGLLVGSLLTHIGGQWAWLANHLSFEFLAPVHVGDTVTVEVTVEALDDEGKFIARAHWVNQRGEPVMTGRLEGYPPREKERALLTRVPEQE
jgi:acyl dehydratase